MADDSSEGIIARNMGLGLAKDQATGDDAEDLDKLDAYYDRVRQDFDERLAQNTEQAAAPAVAQPSDEPSPGQGLISAAISQQPDTTSDGGDDAAEVIPNVADPTESVAPVDEGADDIARENRLLNDRTNTIVNNARDGMITRDGKSYYLISRDRDGVGVYQNRDVTTLAPAAGPSMVASSQATKSAAADDNGALGALSKRFESRGPGTVSNGKGDHGGVSYGSYQLASRLRRPQEFLQSEGAPWAAQFQGMDPAVRDGEFAQTWKRVAQEDPQKFADAQHDYIKRTHYDVAVQNILRQTGLDISRQPDAVKNVVWSTAVQQGPDNSIVAKAYRSIPNVDPNAPNFDSKLINAIYDERGKRKDGSLVYFSQSSPEVQAGVVKRYAQERPAALQMLTNQGQ